jgi:undecaprenyl-diphosphatase
MSIIQVIILAIVQGLAELLPVSSSAHVVVAVKLMGLNPSSPDMTLVLVMLHTGTMFAVIFYFWRQWKTTYFQNMDVFKRFAWLVILATVLTGVVGEAIIKVIEKTAFKNEPKAEIELLFSRLDLIAPALAAAGLIILIAGLLEKKTPTGTLASTPELTTQQAGVIGVVQGLALPFRGFSRSGSTISAGMLAGVSKVRAETFSFALAVVLTPAVVGREALRLLHAQKEGAGVDLHGAIGFSLLGAVCAFFAGLLALRWLSQWLEGGRWYLFGIYCLLAAGVVEYLHMQGF